MTSMLRDISLLSKNIFQEKFPSMSTAQREFISAVESWDVIFVCGRNFTYYGGPKCQLSTAEMSSRRGRVVVATTSCILIIALVQLLSTLQLMMISTYFLII